MGVVWKCIHDHLPLVNIATGTEHFARLFIFVEDRSEAAYDFRLFGVALSLSGCKRFPAVAAVAEAGPFVFRRRAR